MNVPGGAGIPSSRTLSWQQLVESSDPNWIKGLTRPWVYQFSNGRLFYADPNIYTDTGP